MQINDQNLDAVYIFENPVANRIKVGITGSHPAKLLDHANDIWTGRKVICQVCGQSRVVKDGRVPEHTFQGRKCPGSGELPITRDVSLAEKYLHQLKETSLALSKPQSASVNGKIRRLNDRIHKFRHYQQPVGGWRFHVAYCFKSEENILSETHHMLREFEDSRTTLNELFECPAEYASMVVENILDRNKIDAWVIQDKR